MVDKTSKLRLQWVVEGEQRVEASLDLVSSNARAVQDALKLVGATASSSFNTVSREAKEAADDLDLALKKALEFEAALKRAGGIPLPSGQGTNVATQGIAPAGGAGGLHERSRFSRIGSEIRQLPSIGIPGAGFGTDSIANVIRMVGAVQELSTGFGALVPILGAAAAAIGVFAGIMFLLSQRNEESARTTRTLMNLTEQYYRLAINGTQEQIRAAVEEAQLDRDIAQARIDFNRSILEQINREGGDAGRAIADIFNLSGAKELREQTQSLEGELMKSSFAVAYLSSLLDENAAAAERAAKEWEALTVPIEEQQDLQLQAQIQAAQELYALTAENAQERLDAFEEERNALNAELQILEDARGQFEAIIGSDNASLAYKEWAMEQINRIEAINLRLQDLNFTLIPAAEELLPSEAFLAAGSAISGGLGDLIHGIDDFRDRTTDVVPLYGELADAINALADTEQEHADKLLAIQQRLQDAQVEAEYDRSRALEDAEYERSRRLEEVDQEAADARLKLTEDTERKRAQIERRFNRSMLNAIGDRDALAAYQAQQRRADELAELDESHDEQLAVIQRRMDDQKRTIDRSLQDQQRTIQRRYEDQLRTANLAAQRALQLEQQRYTQELAIRQQAYTYAQQQLANALAVEASLQNQGYTAMLTNAVNFWNAMAATAAGQTVNFQGEERRIVIPETVNVDDPFAAGFLQRASGGRFAANQPMIVGEQGAEAVIFDRSGYVANANATNRMAQGSGGNQANITINMDGRSLRAASRREAVRYVGEMLGDLEIE